MRANKNGPPYQGSNLQPPILTGDESTDERTRPRRVPLLPAHKSKRTISKPFTHIRRRTLTKAKHLRRTDMIASNLHLNNRQIADEQ